MATRNTFAVFRNLQFLVSATFIFILYNINIHTKVILLELYFPRESYTEH